MLINKYLSRNSRQSAVIVNLLVFGSLVYFLSQIGSVTCLGKSKSNTNTNANPSSYKVVRSGRRNTNSTHRLKIGLTGYGGGSSGLTSYGGGSSGLTSYTGTGTDSKIGGSGYKDDFDDSTGFYADDHLGGHGHGPSSSQYHYSSSVSTDDHNHGHKGIKSAYGAESSYSLITFITFANFLLFVLYPLLTLPKRARIAHEEQQHLYHTSPVHIHTHVNDGPPPHGGGPPIHGGGPPPHGGGPPIQGYGGGGFADSHGGYQGGPSPPWMGSPDSGGSHGGSYGGSPVYDTGGGGWSPQHYGGGSDSLVGYHPDPMATSYDPNNPAAHKPNPLFHESRSPTKSKTKSSKKKKMKNASSENVPVYDQSPLPLTDFGEYNTNDPNTPADDSILSKDEILQILQDLDKPTADA